MSSPVDISYASGPEKVTPMLTSCSSDRAGSDFPAVLIATMSKLYFDNPSLGSWSTMADDLSAVI
jgi:hypothetical protein